MKLFKHIYRFLIGEQAEPRIQNPPKVVADAIKKRKPVTFFYNGPIDSVQAGQRVKAEMVAMGVTKKGNMAVRAWVEPPSRTKTGFEKGNWRTFLLNRMNQLNIFQDETFDQKRPGYKEGDDSSFLTTYVTSDWSDVGSTERDVEVPEPETPPVDDTPPIDNTPDNIPDTDDVDGDIENLPEPNPINKPSIDPPKVDNQDIEGEDDDENEDGEEENKDDNYDNLNENIKRIKELLYY